MLKLFFTTFLMFQLIFPLPVFAEMVGSFTQVKPVVSLVRAGKELIPSVGHSVSIGDVITTGEGARARMLFRDDSVLTLTQNTKLEIKEYLIEKDKRNSIISLQAGKLRTEVTKFLTPESKFEVHTPTAIAGARGCDWLTVVKSNPGTTVFCLQGTITVVNPEFPTQIITLTAGQYAVVGTGMAPVFMGTFTPEMIQPVLDELGITLPAGAEAGVPVMTMLDGIVVSMTPSQLSALAAQPGITISPTSPALGPTEIAIPIPAALGGGYIVGTPAAIASALEATGIAPGLKASDVVGATADAGVIPAGALAGLVAGLGTGGTLAVGSAVAAGIAGLLLSTTGSGGRGGETPPSQHAPAQH